MIKHYLIFCFSITCLFGGVSNAFAKSTLETPVLENAPPCDLSFIQQPEDVIICPGTFAQFKALVNCDEDFNQHLNYQWQVSPQPNLPFADILLFTDNYDGPTTNQLSIENVTGLGGYRYRLCVFADNCNRVYSDVVTLRNFITQQPQDMEICTGDPAAFSVFFDPPNADVQWQVATGSGSSFTPLTDNLIYQGTQTSNLMITDVAGLDGFYYQAVLNTEDCQVVSDPALLTVIPSPVIEDALVTMCSHVEMEINLQAYLTSSTLGLDLQYEVVAIEEGLTGVPLGTTGFGNPMHTWVNTGTAVGSVTYNISTVNPQNGCENVSFLLILNIFPDLDVTLDPGGSTNVCPEDIRI